MAIVFSSQANVTGGDNIFGDIISNATGVPGFPQGGGRKSRIPSDVLSIRDKMNDIVGKLMGKAEEFDRSYVEKGREDIIEGNSIEGGKVSPLEKAKIRQVYSQTPNFSIIIRKRAFSSLNHLYDPTFMDGAEQWLLRATKRLIERKCAVMAEYERLVKIERMMNVGATTGSILGTILTSAAEDQLDVGEFSAMREMQKIIEARQPPNVTTYFTDPDEPEISDLGHGHGAFEITTISDLNTELDLDGNGSCSFTMEDPYRILFVNEEDIEISIKETMKSLGTRPIKNFQLNDLLNEAQIADEALTKSRLTRGISEITFSISMGSMSGATAILDALGFELTSDNLDDVPEGQTLNSHERTLFGIVLNGLKVYEEMSRLSIMHGQNSNMQDKDNANYVRKRMRLFYLGKSIIQPMDTVNVYMDGGTRRSGEGEDVVETGNIFNLDGAIKTAASVLSRYREDGTMEQGPDEQLLKQEFRNFGKTSISFDDFKKLRTMQVSTECGTHVFGGIVRTVTDKFDASTGKYILSINVDSNMEWMKLSRYNSQPSLDQTQGLVYDPFTMFKHEIDTATGLPIGKPMLLDENNRIIGVETKGGTKCRKTFFDTGPDRGMDVKNIEDLKVDVQRLGGRIQQMFHHAPGLRYRWKEGIMTAIYDMSTVDPLSGNLVDHKQLVRDVGLFTANTAFDNMDAANIICTMVTGQPYNVSTFIQSAMNSGTFIVDTSLNGKRGYFSSLLDIQNSFIKTHGNFEPYKRISIDSSDLAKAILLQQRLTGKSSEIRQLRTKHARLADKVANFKGSADKILKGLLKKLESKRLQIDTELISATNKFHDLTKKGAELEDNVIQIAGDDISFDLAGDISNPTNAKEFGDRLFHATLRRREDVIYNKDKNLLIVSDEYDKDYDIQAFILQLREQLGDMWKSTWQSVHQLCQEVAKTLNFEFFCNSQGHLEFRPPQYNRTPASVLAAMLSLNHQSGIKVFPDFLLKLFQTREESVVNDIMLLEWEIVMNGALLGIGGAVEVQKFVSSHTGSKTIFIISDDKDFGLTEVIKGNAVIGEEERKALRDLVRTANADIQVENSGLFTSKSQVNMYRELVGEFSDDVLQSDHHDFSTFYNDAVKEIAKRSGRPAKNFEEYDKAKVGVKRNGQSSPSTDVSNIISKISGLVSRRAKLLRTLERLLEQNLEFGEVNAGAETKLKSGTAFNVVDLFKKKNSSNKDEVSGTYRKLIEDDTRDVLGHLSGDRFVIRDEHIINSSFVEQPPKMTVAQVQGAEPLVGEGSGKIVGMPIYVAYGVDYDMWRQYGWRNEKTFEKPMFWSADKQCAPYAVMLLSRQRKNIVTGTVTVFGNEFYQLGDVVYVADRHLLYYVHKVAHNISYNGNFKTTLHLKYGHPPGEYIPTPLDIIGKLSTAGAKSQNAFRIRREKSRSNVLLGVLRFPKAEIDIADSAKESMLSGKFAVSNYKKLVNASIAAQREVDETDPENSSKLFIMTYSGDKELQFDRRAAAAEWFQNPEKPTEAKNGVGINSFTSSDTAEINKDPKKLKVESKFVEYLDNHIRLCLPEGAKFSKTENELITKYNMIASQEALTIDGTLENVVEIRLRRAPPGGWKKE